MPLFERKKTVKDLLQGINESLLVLSVTKSDKDVVAIMKNLAYIKEMLIDKSDVRISGNEKDQELSNSERSRINEVLNEISTEMINLDIFLPLVKNMVSLKFESVKQVVDIFSRIFRIQNDNIIKHNPVVFHLTSRPEFFQELILSYNNPLNIPHCGTILRDACRHEDLCSIVLSLKEFYLLFDHAQSQAFDISSDAFSTIKELLTQHKKLVSVFIENNFDVFFSHYQDLYLSDNYMTQRQALKVLSEILLERHNKIIMIKYISNVENLKKIMNLLKDEKKQLAFEAFHCFKVFVAASEKPKAVNNILYQNKDKLIAFLTNFQSDRSDDGQMHTEKNYVINQIKLLPPPGETTMP